MIRLPWQLWLPLDVAGAVIANSIWIGSGALLGRAVLTDDGQLEQHPLLRVGLLVAAMTWLVLMRRVVNRKLAALRAAEPPRPGAGEPAPTPEGDPRP